jgi:outer membrane protein TolC
MRDRYRWVVYVAAAVAALLDSINSARVNAQEPLLGPSAAAAPGVYRLTLEEAKQRALANSKLRSLAYMNITAKQEGIYAMEADYYPKLFAGFTGFHFDEPLGKVLTPGGPFGVAIPINVVNQDLGLATITAAQPITALSAEQAIALALESSPEAFQADQDATKAEAGVRVAKVDYLPDVVVMGGYVNQNGIGAIQNDITYGAVTVNYTLFSGGKRVHALREAETVAAMARQKACQVREEVRLKAQKAYREYEQAQASFKTAGEMLQIRKEVQQAAHAPDEMIGAAGELMKAEAALVQAEVTCRVTGVRLMAITGL